MSNSKQTYRRPEVFYQLAGLQKQKLKYRAGAPGSQNGNSSVYHLCTGQNSVTTRPRADAYRNLRQTVTALITRRRFGIANQIISTISGRKTHPCCCIEGLLAYSFGWNESSLWPGRALSLYSPTRCDLYASALQLARCAWHLLHCQPCHSMAGSMKSRPREPGLVPQRRRRRTTG